MSLRVRALVVILPVLAAVALSGDSPRPGPLPSPRPAQSAAFSQAESTPAFDEFFLDRALRLDLFMTGDAAGQTVTLDRLVQEAVWPEGTKVLVDPFNNGRYRITLYDIASNRPIYSRGFDTMLGEYRTTAPAIAGVQRVFRRSVRVPFPKCRSLAVIEARDRQNIPREIFRTELDPADYHIVRETAPSGDTVYEPLANGDAHDKADVVFLAEGYVPEDLAKFKADVDRFSGLMFAVEPFHGLKSKFSVRAVFRPSAERGTDEPRQGAFKRTALDTSFNAFDIDRYLLCEDGHRLREMAAEVPYDAIVILVNSRRYGGGGIYNDYCATTVDNERSPAVFIHEFGHAFAGLADEYYASEVAYNDFYPKGIEPLEPNITALLDPARLKWKDLVSPETPLPTDWGKDRRDTLQADLGKNRQELRQALEAAKQKGAAEAELKKIQAGFEKKAKAIEASLAAVKKDYAHLEDKVGAFEGAGYAAKGLYRPQIYCLMISSPKNEFCGVCRRAIGEMIGFYGGL